MKKALTLLLTATLLGMNLSPVFAQNAYGQDEETGRTEDAPLVQIQERSEEQVHTEDADPEGEELQVQNQNEIKKVIINKGQDNKLQVHTENQEQEQTELETEEGEQVLLEMEYEEEDNDDKKVKLKVKKNEEGELEIEDGEFKIQANFPMSIDTETGLIVITNPNGKEIELKEKPSSVLAQVLEDKFLDAIDTVELVENENEENKIQYKVNGTNEKKLLGLFKTVAKVEALVDAEDSSDIEIKNPWYLNWFGFLFTDSE